MKQIISKWIGEALERAGSAEGFNLDAIPPVEVDEPKLAAHGDYSTNIAMVLASRLKMAPRRIAAALCDHIEDRAGILDRTEIAGPGFINFFLRNEAFFPVLREVHETGADYGGLDLGSGQRVQVEFVSANPTGPLHVGHGRGAAVGDTVANILARVGFDVQKEYYVNDSGRQIRTLGRSVYLRYLQADGRAVDFPEDCYQGRYIMDLATAVRRERAGELAGADEAKAIDICARYAASAVLTGIRDDLDAFGVWFNRWFSEQELYDNGKVAAAIEGLRQRGIVYEADGAIWFRTSDYGDEKDRVVVRRTGETTYFASDIAYHIDKFERGFERVIDVWGADHHGYIPRMTAAVAAAGREPDRFGVILVKLVNLLRAGEPVAMSTRAGEFVTLREVVDEVGRDAARFIFLTRHTDSPLDFDLELAKQKTNDNPVYYVQYVHARITSILAKGAERGVLADDPTDDQIARLQEPEEIGLLKAMARYPETLASAARFLEPHRVPYYLMSLAGAFHAYYNKHRVLTDEPDLTAGRLYLVRAVRQVIRNGLQLLGVSAPDTM